jgi:hypothetical protein
MFKPSFLALAVWGLEGTSTKTPNPDRIMTEKLSVIYALEFSPIIPLDTLFARVLYDVPSSAITIEEVEAMRDEVMLPIQVPTWFHQIVYRFRELDGEAFLRAVYRAVPTRVPAPFNEEATVRRIAEAWLSFCVAPLMLFPDMHPCAQLPDSEEWRIADWEIHNYLWNLSMKEVEKVKRSRSIERRLKRERSPPSLTECVAQELLRNMDLGLESLYEKISRRSDCPPGLTLLQVMHARAEIFSLLEIPEWLFNTLSMFKGDLTFTNQALIEAVNQVSPRNFRIKKLQHIVPVWNEYCFVTDYEPEKTNGGKMRLPYQQAVQYLRSLSGLD